MNFSIEQIRQAQATIEPYIIHTPLLRLRSLDRYLGCQVYVKAECMQLTGAFKLRGAINKTLNLSQEELRRGIVAPSSGNHGRAIAYAAKRLGINATIVMPNTAPKVKVEAIRALGAEIVSCETSERHRIAREISSERGMTIVSPFNDKYVMAGQGTIGLEIMEQCPEMDAVVVPVSGGGLISGISAAVKAVSPHTKVYGAEPSELPRYSQSLAAGKPITVPMRKTIADALVAQTPGSLCFPVIQECTDGVVTVEDLFMLKGLKLLLLEGKLLAEPSSCIGIGAFLQKAISARPEDKVCFVISGSNVGLEQLRILEDISL